MMIWTRFRLLLICASLTATLTINASSRAYKLEDASLAVIRGHAVCLDKEGRSVDSLFECNSGRFGFIDNSARLYRFLATDSAAEIFNDPRVRQRDLQITARLSQDGKLELIKVQSIHEGKLYDIYYYCELCNIKWYKPGLCPCCRNELEFRETPP